MPVHSTSGDELEFRDRNWEFVEGELSSITFYLRDNILFWKNTLNPSPFVVHILRDGYLLPFTQIPPSFYAENNKSELQYAPFVGRAIETRLSRDTFVVNPYYESYNKNNVFQGYAPCRAIALHKYTVLTITRTFFARDANVCSQPYYYVHFLNVFVIFIGHTFKQFLFDGMQ